MMHWILKREGMEGADFPVCCSYGPVNWENPYKWQGVILGPSGSPYEDGVFFLSIDLPNEYPCKPPHIKFLTKVKLNLLFFFFFFFIKVFDFLGCS